MMEKKKQTEQVMDTEEYEAIIPSLNVSSTPAIPKEDNIISDDAMLGIYGKILDQIDKDRTEVDDYIGKFANMIMNDGDATTSSKEALVNLIKLKVDAADRMSKVAELMTRVKLKDPFPKYLAAHQNNTINISDNRARQALLRAIDKAQKKKEEK